MLVWHLISYYIVLVARESVVFMFSSTVPGLTSLLTTYGYWAVFACIAIESNGIPFPGETMLLVAAIYAGTTHQTSEQRNTGERRHKREKEKLHG